jgi:hypothetical protein
MKTKLFRGLLIATSVLLFSFNSINSGKNQTSPIKGGGDGDNSRAVQHCLGAITNTAGQPCFKQCHDAHMFLGINWYWGEWYPVEVPCPATAD